MGVVAIAVAISTFISGSRSQSQGELSESQVAAPCQAGQFCSVPDVSPSGPSSHPPLSTHSLHLVLPAGNAAMLGPEPGMERVGKTVLYTL